jgi:hypothetical protein
MIALIGIVAVVYCAARLGLWIWESHEQINRGPDRETASQPLLKGVIE